MAIKIFCGFKLKQIRFFAVVYCWLLKGLIKVYKLSTKKAVVLYDTSIYSSWFAQLAVHILNEAWYIVLVVYKLSYLLSMYLESTSMISSRNLLSGSCPFSCVDSNLLVSLSKVSMNFCKKIQHL